MFSYYLNAFSKYATFSGRATKKEFWSFFAIHLLITILFSVISNTIAAVNVLLLIYFIASFLPSLSITTRRLHDIGKSGWYQLVILIPILGAFILLFWSLRGSVDELNSATERENIQNNESSTLSENIETIEDTSDAIDIVEEITSSEENDKEDTDSEEEEEGFLSFLSDD